MEGVELDEAFEDAVFEDEAVNDEDDEGVSNSTGRVFQWRVSTLIFFAPSVQDSYLHHCVNTRHRPRPHTVLLVVFQKCPTRIFIECRFRVRVDKEALDRDKNVLNPKCRLPVLLQRVNADFSRR